MFKHLIKIPILGPIAAIVNGYISSGAFDSDKKMAGPASWLRVFFPSFLLAFILTVAISWEIFQHIFFTGEVAIVIAVDSFVLKPGGLIVGAFPSILGFGIGVYALIFVLSKNFVNEYHIRALQKNEKKGTTDTVLALNSDMGYPLLVLVLAICVGVFNSAFPANKYLVFFGWFAFWYGIIVILDMICTLYRLGENSILEKISNSGQDET